jgi:GDPmannose 4,6-dehydratase
MKVLLTGVNGQDGRIICDAYLAIGAKVYGIGRKEIFCSDGEIVQSETINICNPESFRKFLDYVKPNHIFHLAASHANSTGMKLHGVRSESEMFALHVGATQTILEWQRRNKRYKPKLLVALSSQMYTADGDLRWIDESTPLNPSTIYGETKAKAFELVKEYREMYNVYAVGAILFNHSSRYTKLDFVLANIATQVVAILDGTQDRIVLRDFDSKIDISSAEEICEALLRVVNLDSPQDFVLASGYPTDLRRLTLDCLEHYKISKRIELISTSPSQDLQRTLVGNVKKASTYLNWEPKQDPLAVLVSIVEEMKKSDSDG